MFPRACVPAASCVDRGVYVAWRADSVVAQLRTSYYTTGGTLGFDLMMEHTGATEVIKYCDVHDLVFSEGNQEFGGLECS